jgi:WD40 repeat protein
MGADRTVRFWQPTIGRLLRFVKLPSEPRAVAWTNDGKSAIVACVDGRVRVVDPETAEVRSDLECLSGVAHCLAVTQDGIAIVGGANGQIKSVKLP